MEKVIEIKNLTKSYKDLKAVDDLSFDVYKGEKYEDTAITGICFDIYTPNH